jgi:hypothetical protein
MVREVRIVLLPPAHLSPGLTPGRCFMWKKFSRLWCLSDWKFPTVQYWWNDFLRWAMVFDKTTRCRVHHKLSSIYLFTAGLPIYPCDHDEKRFGDHAVANVIVTTRRTAFCRVFYHQRFWSVRPESFQLRCVRPLSVPALFPVIISALVCTSSEHLSSGVCVQWASQLRCVRPVSIAAQNYKSSERLSYFGVCVPWVSQLRCVCSVTGEQLSYGVCNQWASQLWNVSPVNISTMGCASIEHLSSDACVQ